MDISDAASTTTTKTVTEYDRAKEVQAFDDTKAGVKGLVDAGVVNIPRIFIRPPAELAEELTTHQSKLQVPVIDLDGIRYNQLEDIVDQVRAASQTWGFFQVINHGVPLNLIQEMIEGVHKFNEQDVEVKKQFYTRERTRNVRFNSNFDLYHSRTASWRDTLAISTSGTKSLEPNEWPKVCRDTIMEYIKEVSKLGETLFEILSMALGLKPEYLKDMGCFNLYSVICHYYPHCPQPELTLGARTHSDPSFLTILLQDQIGGLQVFNENQWIDVNPISGGLVVNIGDFLQVVSNDELKSVDHRVVANVHATARVSVACFFTGHTTETQKPFGPIKELISEENPPVYREFLVGEYFSKYFSKELEGKSAGLKQFETMDISDASRTTTQTVTDYDRAKEVQAFDDTKAGVKGLVDAGIVNIPRIFIRPPEELVEELTSHQTNFQVPVIDLDGVRGNKLGEIVDQVRAAAEPWGFFQVVNHGIPLNVLEEMIEGIRKFNEQDVELKKEFYTRDQTRNVRFNSNFDLHYSRTANWRDTLTISTVASTNLDPNEYPEVCRDAAREYIKNVTKLAETLFELLSLALGLKAEHLLEIGCPKEYILLCQYYPPCPQPDLTLGATGHSDPSFLTILLQDQIGGLQVFHDNQWVGVQPIVGGLVVNIGDFLQIISNDKFKSVKHRVVASQVGPRVSVPCFFMGHNAEIPKSYGPIKELTSAENPPIYRDFLASEYFSKRFSTERKMVISDDTKTSSENGSEIDRERKVFDDTKAGVKGLVDAGVVNIRRIFIRQPEELAQELTTHRTKLQLPVVDLDGIQDNKLEDIVDQVRAASETWGFFKVINYGVSLNLIQEMIEGVHKFNEQDVEVKKQFYTREPTRNV
ncbi:hypothetical protein CUMW_142980 [Citrus unshiu]|nr:hypothetical protein CUMW_142980 [Citrus unshiu]